MSVSPESTYSGEEPREVQASSGRLLRSLPWRSQESSLAEPSLLD